MKEKIIYVSDDGEEFETREECESYEKVINEFPDCIIAIGKDGERIMETRKYDDVYKLIIKDGADETLEFLLDYYGCFYGVNESGCWFYSEEEDSWVKFESLLDKVKEMCCIFDKYIDGIE